MRLLSDDSLIRKHISTQRSRTDVLSRDDEIFSSNCHDRDVRANVEQCHQGRLDPIDFSASFNARLQNEIGIPIAAGINLPDANTGSVTYGGVPFFIPTNDPSGNNYWNAAFASGPDPRTLTITTSVFDAVQVNSLINTYAGVAGSSLAYIEFIGTGGASYTYNLVGGVDIRDFNNDGFVNTIDPSAGSHPTQVLSYDDQAQGGRLDMQQFTLPSTFLGQTLTTILLVDNGFDAPNPEPHQRVFLAGMSVSSVPEPSSMILMASGGALISVSLHVLKRRRTRAGNF